MIERELVGVTEGQLELYRTPGSSKRPLLVAAHPACRYSADTATLLADLSQLPSVCVNPRGLGASTAAARVDFGLMVRDLEAVREKLGLRPWIFWGMSGGGWLALAYAHLAPQGLRGIIVESACVCFRERLLDPECALSPWFPTWERALRARGLLREALSLPRALPADTEWFEVPGVGQVLRERGGRALLVSPMPLDADMRRAMPLLWSFDAREWIHTVQTPALVIAGSGDPVVPVHRVRAVHEALAQSTFALVDGGGHVPSSERHASAVQAARSFVAAVNEAPSRPPASVRA